MNDFDDFLASPEWAEFLKSAKGMDQRAGKKELETAILDAFLPARDRVGGETLENEHAFSERPDFICSREDGSLVGVEIAELTNGPNESISAEQAIEAVYRLIADKEKKRQGDDWECKEDTVLVLATARRSIPDLKWWLEKVGPKEFADHGFREVWIADFIGEDAYGTIELFGLHPPKWWGHHLRANPNAKPYG